MDLAVPNNNETKIPRGARTLSVESPSAAEKSLSGEDAGSKVLVLTNSFTPLLNRSTNLASPFGSHQAALPSTPEPTIALADLLPPSLLSVYYTVPRTPQKPSHCGLCMERRAVSALAPGTDLNCVILVQEKKVQA